MSVDPNISRTAIIKILTDLSEADQALLKSILVIERAHIHIPKQPHVKTELLAAVKESIK